MLCFKPVSIVLSLNFAFELVVTPTEHNLLKPCSRMGSPPLLGGTFHFFIMDYNVVKAGEI